MSNTRMTIPYETCRFDELSNIAPAVHSITKLRTSRNYVIPDCDTTTTSPKLRRPFLRRHNVSRQTLHHAARPKSSAKPPLSQGAGPPLRYTALSRISSK